ncbi:MAG: hypothetical protein MJ078_01175, partial [Clostridia bacterium]|nr:hypothetical protein [Clostridia bacterium]
MLIKKMIAVKLAVILVLMLLMLYPLFPLPVKIRKFSTFYGLRYNHPHTKKNLWFVILAFAECLALWVILSLLRDLEKILGGFLDLPFVTKLIAGIPGQVKLDVTVCLKIWLVNLVALYGMILLKAFLKKAVLDPFYRLNKSGEAPAGKTKKTKKKRSVIPFMEHTEEPDEKKKENEKAVHGKVYEAFWGLFFQKPDLVYAKEWVSRAVSVLQTFVYFAEGLYAVFFFCLLLSVFFPLPGFLATALGTVVDDFYVYPFVSLIFLQEVCHTLKSRLPAEEKKKAETPEEEKAAKKQRIALNKLRAKLRRKLGRDHFVRYFPAPGKKEAKPYECIDPTYAGALDVIRKQVKQSTGYVVESYMECLDHLFQGRHVYFSDSFYSMIGEYVVAYTYVRLLSGERLIFVVPDKAEVTAMKKYVGRRLTALTHTTDKGTWRIKDSSERLDQADVLIATPDDFSDDNLVEQNPAFFEEACNAVFVDANRMMNLDSYLCMIMAKRLLSAGHNRIRFLFLTRDVLFGFARSLKKFFCISGDLQECSSARENENVSFMLWNRESRQLHEKDGQKSETMEAIMAEEAFRAQIDGIRVMTSAPIDATDKEVWRTHRVEINELHKDVPDINYMICTDDNDNLASTLYSYTRFHGKQASVLHVISRPYLLREYFMEGVEEYVNRAPLIKPSVTEHAEDIKLRLLSIYLDAASFGEEGILVSEFTERLDHALKEEKEADSAVSFTYQPETCPEARYRDMVEERVKVVLETLMGKSPEAKEIRNFYSLNGVAGQQEAENHKGDRLSFRYAEKVFAALLACNRRVSLRLNGAEIGKLDTFPARIHQQYLPGMSLVYDNSEYEIKSITPDGSEIDLRHENVTLRHCLDTFFLRRYSLNTEPVKIGIVNPYSRTNGMLASIELSKKKAGVTGRTVGYYNLMEDSQTLDFMGGVVGNPQLEPQVEEAHKRSLDQTCLLSLKLSARMECNDRMRMLLSLVLNEFLRTMFPGDVSRCIAVCPVYEDKNFPLSFASDPFLNHIATLYPYLTDCPLKPDLYSVDLLIINDCEEDVGALNMLY